MLRQILALTIFAFLFFGCTQKQVVELKLPSKDKVEKKVVQDKKVEEDGVTIIEELVPIDIQESDNIIEENIPVSENELNQIDSSDLISQQESLQIDGTRAKMQVAFIYPSSLVSKYARNSLNTISGYLSYQKADYNLFVVDSENESEFNINDAFSKVKEKGITKVIALFTPNALNSINKVVTSDMKVYLPLIEKKDFLEDNDSLIFGSISYDEQLKKLSYYSIGNNAMFYQDSYLGSKLRRTYDSLIPDTSVRKEIKKNEKNFRSIVNDYRLKNASLYLNTDIVKTSLILSQLRAYDVFPKIIFSTQIAYDPMLMVLTQDKDRERLVIANSIDDVNSKLKDEITTLGGNITFEWVDYSTLVGINYLFYDNNSSLIPTQVVNNEVIYTPRLFKSTEIGFLEIK